jgi:hypothetical protein
MHAELRLGSAVFMIAPAAASAEWSTLKQFVSLKVDDPDARQTAGALGTSLFR